MLLAVAKAAGLLLMPPGILILAGAAALVLALRSPRAARILAIGVLVVAYLLSIRPVADTLVASLEQRYPPLDGIPSEAQAIVVLSGSQIPGSPEYPGAWLGDSSLQRVHYAAYLARGNDLPIYTTGGTPLDRGIPMGRTMARVLSDHLGMNAGRIVEETASRNTAEHVPLLKPLLDEREQVVLVTTAWHMPRAMATFRAGGLDPTAAPTDYHEGYGASFHWLDLVPSAGALATSSDTFHEYLGMAYYTVRSRM
ncbi:YdcF family protein [Thiohalorhabdus sp.]|uniref:YdcF family protein n=1 Tax=Thiohalorhabdus sp. TaxID=3094134 RepID=UPI002FC2A2CE